MTFHWLNQVAACPVVEFHDIRTEKFRSDRYLALVESRQMPLLGVGGAVALGQFRVENHPDRLMLVRGFDSMGARRRALTAFHSSSEWARQRQEATGLVHDARVMLTRAITPPEGMRPARDGQLVAMISELRYTEQIGNFHLWLRLLLRKAGMDPVAAFATLEAVNDVPAVPVVKNRSQHIALLRTDGPPPQLPQDLRGMLRHAPEVLTLEPAMSLVW